MQIYLVLPYRKNYTKIVSSKVLTFADRESAIAYASEFTYVELITTTLNG